VAPPARPGWAVENQAPSSQLDPNTNRVVRGMEIYFVTPLGNHGSVFVDQQTYNAGPPAVKPLIQKAVDNMDAIHQLGS
jgi:hypothetical protein